MREGARDRAKPLREVQLGWIYLDLFGIAWNYLESARKIPSSYKAVPHRVGSAR